METSIFSSEEFEFWHWLSQYEWLERDLNAVNRTKTPWIVGFWHRPWYSSNKGTEILMHHQIIIYFNSP
jgi:hypothetical protein